jgi:hypothetical protein
MTQQERTWGAAVEGSVRGLAARLSVRDFVMIPERIRRSSGVREVGDGCLVVGGDGAILQVKARDPASAAADSPERAAQWARKQARAAARQGRGTKRVLAAATPDQPVTLLSLRSEEVAEDRREEFRRRLPADVDDWPVIVVLEHLAMPELTLDLGPDEFVITFEDWEALSHAVRSVAGLIYYVRRVLDHPDISVPLGHERERFDLMVRADAATDDGGATWAPWLSYAALEDPDGADMYQHFIDRLWPQGEPLGMQAGDYLHAVEQLDRVPPAIRVELGRHWIGYIEATRHGGRRSGTVLLDELTIVMVVKQSNDPSDVRYFQSELGLLAMLRASEVASALGDRPMLAIGVLSHDGGTDYACLGFENTGVLGPLPEDTAQHVREDFGSLDVSRLTVRRATQPGDERR